MTKTVTPWTFFPVKHRPVFGEISELDFGWIVMWIHADSVGWGRALVLRQGAHFTPHGTKVGSVGKFLWDRRTT